MNVWKTLTDALPGKEALFARRKYIKPEAEFIARREGGEVAERVEIPPQLKARKKSSALLTRTAILGRGGSSKDVEVSDDEFEKSSEDTRGLRSVEDGAQIIALAVAQKRSTEEDQEARIVALEEKIQKLAQELSEVRVHKETDYSQYYEKVSGELFSLEERVAGLEGGLKHLEGDTMRRHNRVEEEVGNVGALLSTKTADLHRLLESRVKQEYVDNGLKMLHEKLAKKLEREVEELDKKTASQLKSNVERLRKAMGSCDTKVGQLLQSGEKLRKGLEELGEKNKENLLKMKGEVLERQVKFRAVVQGQMDGLKKEQDDTFRKLVADKKKLNEQFNKAIERIDTMVDRLRGDHDHLYSVSGKTEKMLKDLNLLCDGLEKFETRVDERHALLASEIQLRPTREKIKEILCGLEEWRNAETVDKKLDDLMINIDEATKRVDTKIDVFRQQITTNSVSIGGGKLKEKDKDNKYGSSGSYEPQGRRLEDVEKLAIRGLDASNHLESFVENLALAVRNLENQTYVASRTPSKLLLGSEGKCMSCGGLGGDHSPAVSGFRFATPTELGASGRVKTEHSLVGSVVMPRTPLSRAGVLNGESPEKAAAGGGGSGLRETRKSCDTARRKTPRPVSSATQRGDHLLRESADGGVVYRKMGTSFSDVSKSAARTPKCFTFAMHVGAARKSVERRGRGGGGKMSELEYSSKQGPNNIFYVRAQSRKEKTFLL